MSSHRSTESRAQTTARASAQLIGGVLVVALTVIVATAVGTAVLGSDSTAAPPEPTPVATIDLSVEGETLIFTHENGEPLDVKQLSVRISVDGEPLAEQPPVPFFSASGFESGPTGPFNSASSHEWTVGETARLTVAGTNSPTIESGSTVSVRIGTDEGALVRAETTV